MTVTHNDLSGHGNAWGRLRRSLGLPLPTANTDAWHAQTVQPDPGAMSYAYNQLAVVFYTPIGTGIWNRRQWMGEIPYLVEPFTARSAVGLGGVITGNQLTSQLLISQADAVARGLIAAGQPVPPGVMPNG